MPVAVTLFMDQAGETAVTAFWRDLAAAGITSYPLDHGVPPHITLGIWEALDHTPAWPILTNFAAQTTAFPFLLSSLSVFPDGVLYLAPRVTDELLLIHRSFHQQLEDLGEGLYPQYQPDHWTPHVTCSQGLNRERIGQAIALGLQGHVPISGRITQLGMLAFFPVQTLGLVSLRSP